MTLFSDGFLYNPVGICSDISVFEKKDYWIFSDEDIYVYAIYCDSLGKSKFARKMGTDEQPSWKHGMKRLMLKNLN